MLILTQDSMTIFETEKFDYITAKEDGQVVVRVMTSDGLYEFPLGKYVNEERARGVVEDIFSMMGAMSKFDMPVA